MVVMWNIIYASIGGLLAIAFMAIGYKVLDKITPFDTGKELSGVNEDGGKGNIAVGLAVGGMFIGIGLAVGLVLCTSFM